MSKILNFQWVTEICKESGTAFSLEIDGDCLFREKTPYQTIEIYQTTKWGKLMVIDGYIMLSSFDNFFYHEMMSHIPLFAHQQPQKVVIIGGGDCGTLKEVLKHDVKEVWQIEIDESVTRSAEIYFPELCESNHDPRANFYFGDGIKWMAEADKNSIDVIIVDSTDPIGPAAGLFNEAFYKSCYQALRDGGVLMAQGESPLIHMNIIKEMHGAMVAAGFSQTRVIPFPQPVYPSGWWSGTLASKNSNLEEFRFQDADNKNFATKYYNARIHQGALATPDFILCQL